MKVPEEKKLYRIAFWLLTLILGSTFFVAWGLNFIKFDYNFEKFFPEKDIRILEGRNIPVVGVGESTLKPINGWLNLMGIEDKEVEKLLSK